MQTIPHDLRVTYVAKKYEELLANCVSNDEALKLVSKEVNHYRAEITEYYLLRAYD